MSESLPPIPPLEMLESERPEQSERAEHFGVISTGFGAVFALGLTELAQFHWTSGALFTIGGAAALSLMSPIIRKWLGSWPSPRVMVISVSIAWIFVAINIALLIFGQSNSETTSSISPPQLEWLLPSEVAERCRHPEWDRNADDISVRDGLLLKGIVIARGQRVILTDNHGNRTTEKEITNIRPGDWQRLALQGTRATAEDGIFGQYVGLEMAIVKPCR
jgi:hypothetical protein